MQQCLALGSPLLTAAEQARRAYGASVTPLRECSATCIGWRNSRRFRSSDVQLGAALPDRIPPFLFASRILFPRVTLPYFVTKVQLPNLCLRNLDKAWRCAKVPVDPRREGRSAPAPGRD